MCVKTDRCNKPTPPWSRAEGSARSGARTPRVSKRRKGGWQKSFVPIKKKKNDAASQRSFKRCRGIKPSAWKSWRYNQILQRENRKYGNNRPREIFSARFIKGCYTDNIMVNKLKKDREAKLTKLSAAGNFRTHRICVKSLKCRAVRLCAMLIFCETGIQRSAWIWWGKARLLLYRKEHKLKST